jgi:hypothetical protein
MSATEPAASIMTEDQARPMQKRSRSRWEGRLLSVQMPPEDCEIVAAIDPPSSRHARTFV